MVKLLLHALNVSISWMGIVSLGNVSILLGLGSAGKNNHSLYLTLPGVHFHVFLPVHLDLPTALLAALHFPHGISLLIPGQHFYDIPPVYLCLLPFLSAALQWPHGLLLILSGVHLNNIIPVYLHLIPSLSAAWQLCDCYHFMLHRVHFHDILPMHLLYCMIMTRSSHHASQRSLNEEN